MKNLLFLCVENSCRSQMAEAFANIHGKDIIQAFSRGSNPSGIINENAILVMKKWDYDLSNHQSKSLDELPDLEFDIVISMGCDDTYPSVHAKEFLTWDILDPKDFEPDEFIEVSKQIESNVKSLINNITKNL